MMQKNEKQLLEPWILYHGLHFGFENLYVYDNGSSEASCVALLKKYENYGVNVNWAYKKNSDFESKGHIFSEKIKQLDRENPSDFYFPMDCDEFIAVEKGVGNVSVDAYSILNSLSEFRLSAAPLSICTAYDNNPAVRGKYYRASGQIKTFFAKGTCWTLDLGFHDGKTKSGEAAVKTKIAYIHFHYKEFKNYFTSAVQKLEGRVKNFTVAELEEYSKKKLAGYHLIGALLAGRDKYYESHVNRYKSRSKSFYTLDSFDLYMNKLGLFLMPPHPRLIEAFEKDIPRWKGYIDRIIVKATGFELEGWIVTLHTLNIQNVRLAISDRQFHLSSYSRYKRSDVLRKVDYADDQSGITMRFQTNSLPGVIEKEKVSVYLEDCGDRFNFSFSGKIEYLNT
jgi:hypothetical protein